MYDGDWATVGGKTQSLLSFVSFFFFVYSHSAVRFCWIVAVVVGENDSGVANDGFELWGCNHLYHFANFNVGQVIFVSSLVLILALIGDFEDMYKVSIK